MSKIKILIFVSLMGILVMFSCNENPPTPEPEPINLVLNFLDNVEMDSIRYVNAAGNPYSVSEIQYFISDVFLYKENGDKLMLDGWDDIHYVDSDIPESSFYNLGDDIEPGIYAGMGFTFGINEEKNQSMLFVNPPESFMFWPEYLGGGFHYLKLNGKWLDQNGDTKVYNFHLGIGQEYDDEGVITGFVQNYFEVGFYRDVFTVEAGQTIKAELLMDVDKWFTSPHDFDFNVWGGDIMQNQEAMEIGCENGLDVFRLERLSVFKLEK